MISVISRNNPLNHPIISNIYYCLVQINNTQISQTTPTKFGITFYFSNENYHNSKYVIIDDPLAYVYAVFFLKIPSTKIIFYSLEMYEFQVKNNTIKNMLRNRVFSLFHKLALRHSKKVIFPSKLRAGYYASIIKRDVHIICNYPCKHDLDVAVPDNEVLDVLNSLKEQSMPIAVYAGSFQDGRGIDAFIKIAKKNSKINFLLVGVQGDYNKNIIPDNIFILGRQPRKIVNYLYQHSSIGLLFYENNPLNTKLCAPVKIWEYEYFRLNIVGNDNYALRNEWHSLIDGYLADDYKITLLKNIRNKNDNSILFYEDVFLDFLKEIDCYEL